MSALHLLADSEKDVALISALVQDAILSSDDIRYDPGQQHVALMMSRFRWEDAHNAASRVRSLLVIRDVTTASRLRWPAEAQPLELLALRQAHGSIRLDFAGGAALKLGVARLRLALEDVGDSWRVRRLPRHEG